MSSYGLEIISREQCYALIGTQRVGRVAVVSGHPGVFPVLYALLDEDVVFRTAPGTKLVAAALNRDVVFEVDSFDVVKHTGWSVNVFGQAEEIVAPDEVARVESLGLESWAGEVRDRVVRIRAVDVSGRRVVGDAATNH
jgi:uncharacterized protein